MSQGLEFSDDAPVDAVAAGRTTRHRRRVRFARSVLPAARLAALVALLSSAALAQSGGAVSITGQWMRALGGALPAAGYFTLRNDTEHPIILIGAGSSACASLTLHQTIRQHPMSAMSGLDAHNPPGAMGPIGGMSGMQAVASLPIAAHGSVEFAPGGFHLMCEQPTKAVRAGQHVAITLRFEGGIDLTREFPVKGPRVE